MLTRTAIQGIPSLVLGVVEQQGGMNLWWFDGFQQMAMDGLSEEMSPTLNFRGVVKGIGFLPKTRWELL